MHVNGDITDLVRQPMYTQRVPERGGVLKPRDYEYHI